ncbi:MAG: N-acetyl-gamma-glutamyl-phosphate reductase [Calditrichaceae bacterium]
MAEISVSIVGASGYTGGELLRLLLFHPEVNIKQVTSERFFGKPIHKVHPNLRKLSALKFSSISDLEPCDLLFLCLPHGESMRKIDQYKKLSKKIIDLSADFRLQSAALYEKWYKKPHENAALLNEFVYGIPELHREEMQKADFISSAGCNATATILGLYPLFKNNLADINRTVVEVKVGSSEGGNKSSIATHHPERSGCVRSFSPTGHRHVAEMIQELGMGKEIQIHFSATSIDMVRGVLATSHVFLNEPLEDKDIWKIYRQAYGDEPFVRIVKERDGHYRYPEPKLLAGTNYCDVGFETDPHSNRLVVISAIDNLMKGAAGQAVQAMNLMYGYEETTALQFPGLHPV